MSEVDQFVHINIQDKDEHGVMAITSQHTLIMVKKYYYIITIIMHCDRLGYEW